MDFIARAMFINILVMLDSDQQIVASVAAELYTSLVNIAQRNQENLSNRNSYIRSGIKLQQEYQYLRQRGINLLQMVDFQLGPTTLIFLQELIVFVENAKLFVREANELIYRANNNIGDYQNYLMEDSETESDSSDTDSDEELDSGMGTDDYNSDTSMESVETDHEDLIIYESSEDEND